jgi:hypothetical protein
MKMTAFWNIAPCSHEKVDRRFRSAYCFHNRPHIAPRILVQIYRRFRSVMALMVEMLCMSETSVNSYQNKLHNIPDENHLKNVLIIKFLTQEIPMIK